MRIWFGTMFDNRPEGKKTEFFVRKCLKSSIEKKLDIAKHGVRFSLKMSHLLIIIYSKSYAMYFCSKRFKCKSVEETFYYISIVNNL